MQVPFAIEGSPVSVSVSIGIAMCPADGADPEELLRSADMAMYRTKERGGDSVGFFQKG